MGSHRRTFSFLSFLFGIGCNRPVVPAHNRFSEKYDSLCTDCLPSMLVPAWDYDGSAEPPVNTLTEPACFLPCWRLQTTCSNMGSKKNRLRPAAVKMKPLHDPSCAGYGLENDESAQTRPAS